MIRLRNEESIENVIKITTVSLWKNCQHTAMLSSAVNSQHSHCCWITVNRNVAEVQLEVYWPIYRPLKVVTIKPWFCEKELWSETSVHVICECRLCKEGSFSLIVAQVTLLLNTDASYHCVVHTYWTHNRQCAESLRTTHCRKTSIRYQITSPWKISTPFTQSQYQQSLHLTQWSITSAPVAE